MRVFWVGRSSGGGLSACWGGCWRKSCWAGSTVTWKGLTCSAELHCCPASTCSGLLPHTSACGPHLAGGGRTTAASGGGMTATATLTGIARSGGGAAAAGAAAATGGGMIGSAATAGIGSGSGGSGLIVGSAVSAAGAAGAAAGAGRASGGAAAAGSAASGTGASSAGEQLPLGVHCLVCAVDFELQAACPLPCFPGCRLARPPA